MKNLTLSGIESFFILILCGVISAQSPNLIWAKQFGGNSHEGSYALTVDKDGNIYSTGVFAGISDFDPSSSGVFNLTGIGLGANIYVSKVDSKGNFIWAKHLGVGGGYSIAIDKIGNIYTSGYFIGTNDFDPGNGTFNLSSSGNTDIFISKLDPNGNFIWAKKMGGPQEEACNSLAINTIGNICLTGNFSGTVDFDPGPSTFQLTSGVIEDIFVVTLDESGSLLWAKKMGGGWGYNGNTGSSGSSVAYDKYGNAYITGFFSSTGDFDPGVNVFNLYAPNNTDIFISKLDPSGNFVWAKQIGGGFSAFDYSNSIKIDENGNLYLTGSFGGAVDFNPSISEEFNLSAQSNSEDIFILKLTENGDFIWAKKMGGPFGDVGQDLAIDSSSNVFITGKFFNEADFNPSSEIFKLFTSGNTGSDIFISKLDHDGNFLWAKQLGGFSGEIAESIILDKNFNIYISGYFLGTVDFDPNNEIYNLTSNGGYDAFVVKFCEIINPIISGSTKLCLGSSVVLTSTISNSYLWSNGDTTQNINITTPGNYVVTVTNSNGCSASSKIVTVIANPFPPNPIISSNSPTTFCQGNSVTLNTSACTNCTYLWSSGQTTQNIVVSTSGNYNVTVSNSNGCTAVSTSTPVKVNSKPIVTIMPSGPTTFCQGEVISLTSNFAEKYLWSSGQIIQTINVSTTGLYVVTITDINGCTAISQGVSIVVNPTIIPQVSISASSSSICQGDNITLNASSVNGGTAPTYQWYVNNVLQSSTASTINSTNFTNGSQVSCTMTSNVKCVSQPTVQSNIISIAVNPLLTPQVTISTQSQSILVCQNAVFNATTINGGISPSYQWFLNGNLVGTAAIYLSSALTNGNQIYCKMTSNATCKSTPTVQSNTITMVVNPLSQPNIIVSNDTIYSSNYRDAQFGYKWFLNGKEISTKSELICKQFGSGTYYLVVNFNGCTSTSVTKDIICTSATKDNSGKNNFTIYPNPTNNFLNIKGKVENNTGFKIAIYNVLGIKIEEKLLSADGEDVSTQLNLENYSKGIYMISIFSDNSKQVFRVFKFD